MPAHQEIQDSNHSFVWLQLPRVHVKRAWKLKGVMRSPNFLMARDDAFAVVAAMQKESAAEKEEHQEAVATTSGAPALVYHRCGCELLADPDVEVVEVLAVDYLDSSSVAVAEVLVIALGRDLPRVLLRGLAHDALAAKH